jgi:hypothetical protein
MSKSLERPVSNFTAPATNYALIVIGGFVLLCLVAGLLMAIMAASGVLAGIFAAAILGTVALIYLNLRQSRKIAVGAKNERISWETALPEVQRQNLNIEISELGRILEVEDEQMGDLLSAYIVAEDLALRQIQHKEKLPVLRHVSIGRTPFDGILIKEDMVTCISVTFVVQPLIRQEKVDSMMRKMAAVRKTFGQMNAAARVRFLLVVVTQIDPSKMAELRSLVQGQFASTPVTMQVHFLDFETLQRTYAIDG